MNRLKINVDQLQQSLNEHISLKKENETQLLKHKIDIERLEFKNQKLREKLEEINYEAANLTNIPVPLETLKENRLYKTTNEEIKSSSPLISTKLKPLLTLVCLFLKFKKL